MTEPIYTQKQIEAKLRTAREASRYGAWQDLMKVFTDKERQHVANLLAHNWEITGIVLSRRDETPTTLGNAKVCK